MNETKKNLPPRGYGIVNLSVMTNPDLSITEKGLYAYLSAYREANTSHTIALSKETILEVCQISRDTYRKAAGNLEKYGICRRYMDKNSLRFQLPSVPPRVRNNSNQSAGWGVVLRMDMASALTIKAKAVLGYLSAIAGAEEKVDYAHCAFPKKEQMMKSLCIGDSIDKHLKELEIAGLLSRTQTIVGGRFDRTIYQLLSEYPVEEITEGDSSSAVCPNAMGTSQKEETNHGKRSYISLPANATPWALRVARCAAKAAKAVKDMCCGATQTMSQAASPSTDPASDQSARSSPDSSHLSELYPQFSAPFIVPVPFDTNISLCDSKKFSSTRADARVREAVRLALGIPMAERMLKYSDKITDKDLLARIVEEILNFATDVEYGRITYATTEKTGKIEGNDLKYLLHHINSTAIIDIAQSCAKNACHCIRNLSAYVRGTILMHQFDILCSTGFSGVSDWSVIAR